MERRKLYQRIKKIKRKANKKINEKTKIIIIGWKKIISHEDQIKKLKERTKRKKYWFLNDHNHKLKFKN